MSAHHRKAPQLATVSLIVSLCGLAAGCSDSYNATGPRDTTGAGELCAPPQSGCRDQTSLHRAGTLSVSRLDFELRNEGQAAEVTVEILAPDAPSIAPDGDGDASDAALDATLDAGADASSTSDAGGSTPGGVIASYTYQMGESETLTDQIGRDTLSTRSSFELRLRCDNCTAHLTYVLASEPLECRADEDCGGNWSCETERGYCVECLSSADCAEEQECSSQTNRCTPEVDASCGSVASGGGPSPLSFATAALALITCLMLIRIGKRRRRVTVASLIVLLAACVMTTDARSNPPRAGIDLDLGSRFLTGEMGEHTDRGIGLSLAQELRSDHVGGRFDLGASYFLTHQPPPPLSRELQMYSVGIGPRFYAPIGPLEAHAGVAYRRVGLMSNSLVRITGPRTSHNAVGLDAGLQYRAAPLQVGLHGGYRMLFGLDSGMITIDLSVGLAGGAD